jgi:hypothetical protein
VRIGSNAVRGTRLVAGLTSTPRRAWLTTFVLVTSLCAVWALSQPVFAGPDEPAHVVRADGIAHGELIGSEPGGRVPRALRRVDDDVRIVRAPQIYGSVVVPCFAHQRDLLAPCLRFSGPTTDADVASYESLQPPAYYAVVGLTSWLSTPGTRTVYVMRLVSAVLTGALIATAFAAVRRSAAPRLLGTGVVLAVTPMVLFLGGVVGPAGTEIAAAIAFWVCGLVLLSRAPDRVESSLITGAGIAGCVLALSRPLGPLWIGLIALTLAGATNRTTLRTITRSGRARVWAALVVAAMAVQVAWNVIVGPSDATLTGHAATKLSTLSQLGDALGATYGWYREMIGSFGWNETLAPALTWVPWTAALGFLFFAALAWVAGRYAGVLLALITAVIIVPIVLELTPYHVEGGVWLGSTTLPLAVGVPILAAHALTTAARGRELLASRFVLAVGVVAAVGQFLAFAANLRRYTVGGTRDLLYWLHAQWDPPLPALVLTVGYAALLFAFLACVLGGDGRRADGSERRTPAFGAERALDKA